MIHVLYFARFREELDTAAEELEASGFDDVGSIITLLRDRGGSWSSIFSTDQTVMIAVNQEVADAQTPIKDGDEVAFFPPVTGG